jgi:hypothetical protein
MEKEEGWTEQGQGKMEGEGGEEEKCIAVEDVEGYLLGRVEMECRVSGGVMVLSQWVNEANSSHEWAKHTLFHTAKQCLRFPHYGSNQKITIVSTDSTDSTTNTLEIARLERAEQQEGEIGGGGGGGGGRGEREKEREGGGEGGGEGEGDGEEDGARMGALGGWGRERKRREKGDAGSNAMEREQANIPANVCMTWTHIDEALVLAHIGVPC